MEAAAAIAGALIRIEQLIQAGRLDEAESSCRKLLQAAPESADAWIRLGTVQWRRGALSKAEDAIQEALAREPNSAAAWNQLAVVRNKRGQSAEAVAAARCATALSDTQSSYWATLGAALYGDQSFSEAIVALQNSLAKNPGDAATWNNLGSAEQKLGRFAEAQQAFERAMALAPGQGTALTNYAYLLCQRGERESASAWLQQRLVWNPLIPESWMMLGDAWQLMGQWGLSATAYRRALDVSPQHAAARFQLARMLRSERRLSEAEDTIRELLANQPGHADGLALWAEILEMQGRTAEALPLLRRSVDLAPNADRNATLLLAMQYEEEANPAQLLAAHREWDDAFARPLTPVSPVHLNRSASANALRIGFVSGDFGRHPVAFLALPCLEHLDRNQCQIVCYSDRASEDEFTARFRAASAAWRMTSGLSDHELAALILKDKIDVLVDLMGHTGKRLLVFARRPAPLQVSWLGYVGTTGIATIDGIIADRFHVREGEEQWYSERILRLPGDYACFGPPADAPEVGPLPAQSLGQVTLGCFNNPAKYSPRMMQTWAEILRRLPTASLLLKYGSLDDQQVQARLRGSFEARGVSAERILCEGSSPPAELLACYNRVDLALDTQPYAGGLTTCEALWMGVPVVTFPGKTFAGRHAVSHLTNAGYGQFVAGDLFGYIETAVRWAQRLDELAALRARMRENVRASPLCDAPQFAADFQAALSAAFQSRIRASA